MSEWRVYVVDGFALLGAVMMTISVGGMLRIPDPFGKMHAAAKAVVLGIAAMLAALAFTGELELIGRGLLVGVFLLFTAPAGAHALARLEGRARVDADNQPDAPLEDSSDAASADPGETPPS